MTSQYFDLVKKDWGSQTRTIKSDLFLMSFTFSMKDYLGL